MVATRRAQPTTDAKQPSEDDASPSTDTKSSKKQSKELADLTQMWNPVKVTEGRQKRAASTAAAASMSAQLVSRPRGGKGTPGSAAEKSPPSNGATASAATPAKPSPEPSTKAGEQDSDKRPVKRARRSTAGDAAQGKEDQEPQAGSQPVQTPAGASTETPAANGADHAMADINKQDATTGKRQNGARQSGRKSGPAAKRGAAASKDTPGAAGAELASPAPVAEPGAGAGKDKSPAEVQAQPAQVQGEVVKAEQPAANGDTPAYLKAGGTPGNSNGAQGPEVKQELSQPSMPAHNPAPDAKGTKGRTPRGRQSKAGSAGPKAKGKGKQAEADTNTAADTTPASAAVAEAAQTTAAAAEPAPVPMDATPAQPAEPQQQQLQQPQQSIPEVPLEVPQPAAPDATPMVLDQVPQPSSTTDDQEPAPNSSGQPLALPQAQEHAPSGAAPAAAQQPTNVPAPAPSQAPLAVPAPVEPAVAAAAALLPTQPAVALPAAPAQLPSPPPPPDEALNLPDLASHRFSWQGITEEELRHRRLRLAGAVRRSLCPDPDDRPPGGLNARTLLAAPPLRTQVLEYRKGVRDRVPCGTCVVVGDGLVYCNCFICKGKAIQGLGEFEKHCGSSHKKPADYTWILGYEMTLKELITLVLGGPLSQYGNLQLPLSGKAAAAAAAEAALRAERDAQGSPGHGPARSRPGKPAPGELNEGKMATAPRARASARQVYQELSSSDDDEGEYEAPPPPRASGAGRGRSSGARASNPGLQVYVPPPDEPQVWRIIPTPPVQLPPGPMCLTCRKPEVGGTKLVCSGCGACYHQSCLKLAEAPEGEWQCSVCKQAAAGGQDILYMPPAIPAIPPAVPAGVPAPLGFARHPQLGQQQEETGSHSAAAEGQAGAAAPAEAGQAGAPAVSQGTAAGDALYASDPAAVQPALPGPTAEQGGLQGAGDVVMADAGAEALAQSITAAAAEVVVSGAPIEDPAAPAAPAIASVPATALPSQPEAGSAPLQPAAESAAPAAAHALPGVPASHAPGPAPAAPDALAATSALSLPAAHGAHTGPGGPLLPAPHSHTTLPTAALPQAPAATLPPPPAPPAGAVTTAPTGRIQMSMPSAARTVGARGGPARNRNKHNRLFDPAEGALTHGQKVRYVNGGQVWKEGTIFMQGGNNGVMCSCCNKFHSPSAWEGHAGFGTRRNPYDGIRTEQGVTLRAIASRLPPLPEDMGSHEECGHAGAGRGSKPSGRGRGRGRGSGASTAAAPASAPVPEEDVEGPQTSALTSSCVICFDAAFDREGFSDKTVLICDQCEREYHVGCLRQAGIADLHAVPEGDWFCSEECSVCNKHLKQQVALGEQPCSNDGHTWRLMHGDDDQPLTSRMLTTVHEVLQESFDPIISDIDHMDLLPSIVASEDRSGWDFRGMHSLLLKYRGRPVCAAVLRVFGSSLAELPLVATKQDARRQGHCKVLVRAVEDLLTRLGVRALALPAAHDAVETWIRGFGFRYMHPLQLQCAQAELRLLVFPGTQVLYRNLSGEQGQPFYSVNGGKAMLLQAYPDALPEAVTEYIRSQKLVIAHDAATHGFVLPGYPTTPELQELVKQQTELRQQQAAARQAEAARLQAEHLAAQQALERLQEQQAQALAEQEQAIERSRTLEEQAAAAAAAVAALAVVAGGGAATGGAGGGEAPPLPTSSAGNTALAPAPVPGLPGGAMMSGASLFADGVKEIWAQEAMAMLEASMFGSGFGMGMGMGGMGMGMGGTGTASKAEQAPQGPGTASAGAVPAQPPNDPLALAAALQNGYASMVAAQQQGASAASAAAPDGQADGHPSVQEPSQMQGIHGHGQVVVATVGGPVAAAGKGAPGQDLAAPLPSSVTTVQTRS